MLFRSLVAAGHRAGLRTACEVFADRAYRVDGTLMPRSEPGAVIDDPDAVERRVIAAVGHRPLIPGVGAQSLGAAVRRYLVSAAFVIAAGTVLPRIAVEIARQMGWSNTFVGTIFVALATSIPEVAVSITAMAIGSVDMAVANLLGSNLFDVAIVAIDDLVYSAGPILSAVSPSHAVTAVSAAVMSGVAIVGFIYRPTRRLFRLSSWVGVSLFCIYLLNAFVQYLHGE